MPPSPISQATPTGKSLLRLVQKQMTLMALVALVSKDLDAQIQLHRTMTLTLLQTTGLANSFTM